MKFPKLTNGQYDRIKQFLLMVVPAATAVITGVGVIPPTSTFEQAERSNSKSGMIVLFGFIFIC